MIVPSSTLPGHDPAHEHDFRPIIRRPPTPPFWEYIVGWRCDCGATSMHAHGGRMFDPVANARAAVRRYLSERAPAWQ